MSSPRILFMGTPTFAAHVLRRLVEGGYPVIAAVAAPDNTQGRRRGEEAVKRYAQEQGIPILQPQSLKDAQFLSALSQLKADLQVVVAFRKLPEAVWRMPRLGAFNLHASLLPHYRGAAPIPWAIINGEKETGVTTFFIDKTIDTGRMILQEKEPIYDSDDAGVLHDRLMERGAQLTLKTVDLIASGRCPSTLQPTLETIKLAPKIFSHTSDIDWRKPTRDIINLIRGLSPHPGARISLGECVFKVFAASPTPTPEDSRGSFTTDGRTYLRMQTADGWLSIDELQAEGRRRMDIRSFLQGNSIEALLRNT